jgi:hypothetical protein
LVLTEYKQDKDIDIDKDIDKEIDIDIKYYFLTKIIFLGLRLSLGALPWVWSLDYDSETADCFGAASK